MLTATPALSPLPTPRETALFFLTPPRALTELAPERDDDEDGLTLVKYYSPTSD